MSGLDGVESAAFRRLLNELVDLDVGDQELTELSAVEKVDRVIQQRREREQRIQELEARVEDFEGRVPENSTKKAKVRSIVQYAENQRSNGAEGVAITPEEIQGATGVSERYAYKLADADEGLPADYEWICTPTEAHDFGGAEYDRSEQSKQIIVDFAGVQSDGVPLIMINNAERKSGGSETAQEGNA